MGFEDIMAMIAHELSLGDALKETVFALMFTETPGIILAISNDDFLIFISLLLLRICFLSLRSLMRHKKYLMSLDYLTSRYLFIVFL